MTKRFAFLLGTLCGLVLGGLLVDLNSVDIPDDWQRREFDGQPFYLIPLAAHHSDQQA